MKIAHIVCAFPPYHGGMGRAAEEMVSGLGALGHDVQVFTPDYRAQGDSERSPELKSQVEYAKRLKPTIEYGNAAYLPQIRRELDDMDLVHLHYPFFGTANLVRRWKKKNPSKPLVITYHMDTRGPGWKGLVFKGYSKFWMPKILCSADKLIASSFDYIESSQAAEIFGDNKNKWAELPFGVDTERFAPRDKPLELFKKYNFDPKMPTLLFVGGMDEAHYFKGVDVLLKSLLLLKESNIYVQAVLVGDGGLREGYELRAKGYGISDRVRFVGGVSNEDLPSYYNMADVFVLPSIHQGEAFGMVLLEAMASGVPVIASDLPGVRIVASEGGALFKPQDSLGLGDAIVGFFDKKTDRAKWGRDVRKIVEEKYSWERVVKELESLYLELVDR